MYNSYSGRNLILDVVTLCSLKMVNVLLVSVSKYSRSNVTLCRMEFSARSLVIYCLNTPNSLPTFTSTTSIVVKQKFK